MCIYVLGAGESWGARTFLIMFATIQILMISRIWSCAHVTVHTFVDSLFPFAFFPRIISGTVQF